MLDRPRTFEQQHLRFLPATDSFTVRTQLSTESDPVFPTTISLPRHPVSVSPVTINTTNHKFCPLATTRQGIFPSRSDKPCCQNTQCRYIGNTSGTFYFSSFAAGFRLYTFMIHSLGQGGRVPYPSTPPFTPLLCDLHYYSTTLLL